jgi:hypothetical protein
MSEKYTNDATSDHRALIVYLLDISGSMGKPMARTGKTRIEAVSDALFATIQEMVGRSVKQEIIRPRYEIAVYAYSDDVYDIYGGVREIDYVADKGIPQLHLQNRTDMALGFKSVRDLLVHEINSWTDDEKLERPTPLVVHMTDAEFTERLGNPLPFVDEIKKMKVPDGNILIENIFITEDIKLSTSDLTVFEGFRHGEVLDNPFGETLLMMSSVLPEKYREVINSTQGMNLQQGATLMFPGMTPEFVQSAFVISGLSGVALARKPKTGKWEDD